MNYAVDELTPRGPRNRPPGSRGTRPQTTEEPMPITLDPGFRAEAFHQVMRLLAQKHEASRQPTAPQSQGLDLAWAVSLAEAAATYLAVLARMDEVQRHGDVDLDEALDQAIDIWRSEGWRISRRDDLTSVIVRLAEEAASRVSALAPVAGPMASPWMN